MNNSVIRKALLLTLTLSLLLSMAACGNAGSTENEAKQNNESDTQSLEQDNQEVSGDEGASVLENSYATPQISDGYVLVRKVPDSDSHTVYWYDLDGRLMEHDITDLDDSSKIEAHFIYEYQENEDGTCFVTSTAEEDFPYAYYEYLYDENGNMISMAKYFSAGYSSADYTEEYTYNDDGDLVRTTYKDGSYYSFAYDANGNLIRESSNNKDGEEASWNEYTLDEYGRVIHVDYLLWGSIYDEDWEWSYLWDEDGRLTKLEARDDNGATRFFQLYTYNESGNLVELEDKHEGVTYYYAPLSEALLS